MQTGVDGLWVVCGCIGAPSVEFQMECAKSKIMVSNLRSVGLVGPAVDSIVKSTQGIRPTTTAEDVSRGVARPVGHKWWVP